MNFDDTLVAASRGASGLDPSMLYDTVRNSPDTGTAMDNAQATEAFGSNVKMSSVFNASDPWVQQLILQHLTPDQYKMLTAASGQGGGGQPQTNHSHGLWSDALNAVGGALGAAGSAIGTGVSEGLHVLGAPLRATEHLVRTTMLMDAGSGNYSPLSTKGFSDLFDTSAWANAWNRSEHGEQTFEPGTERKLRGQYGDQAVDLASKAVSGTDMQNYIAKLPDEQTRMDTIDQMNAPGFHALTTQLNAAKLSFGRGLVASLGIGPTGHSVLPSWLPIIGHQDLQSLLSGVTDAVTDIGIDPTLAAGKAVGSIRAARFLVNADDAGTTVERLVQTNNSVQRLLADQSGYLQRIASGDGTVGDFLAKYPKYDAAVSDWVKRGITTQEDLGKWYTDQAASGALMAGKIGGWSKEGFLMPHLTMAQQIGLNLKGGMNTAINWAADHAGQEDAIKALVPASEEGLQRGITETPTIGQMVQPQNSIPAAVSAVFRPMGKFARQLTTLRPEGMTVDPNSDGFLTTLQRVFKMGLPEEETNRLLNAAAQAPTEAGKKLIFKGGVLETMHAMGVDSTDLGRQYMNKWAATFDSAVEDSSYAPGQLDQLPIAGKNVASGVLKGDASQAWRVPNYKVLWAGSNRNAVSTALFGAVNSELADKFMSEAWKPTMIMRPGFAVRAGGDEAVNDILRQGPVGFLRSRAAMSAGKEYWAKDGGVIDSLIQHLPGADQIQNAKDLASRLWTDTYTRAMRNVEGRIAGEKMMTYNGELHEMFQDALPDQLSMAGGMAGYTGNEQTVTQMMRDGEMAKLAYQPTGGFTDYVPTDQGYVQGLKVALDRFSHDAWGREALGLLDEDRPAAVSQLADMLQKDPDWLRMSRSKVLRDGSQVGVDATAEQAARDHANVLLDYGHAITENADGVRAFDPQTLLEKGVRTPDIVELQRVSPDRLPPMVNGPEVLPVAQNGWRSFMQKGFQTLAGRPMNWIARQPIFQHNYALSRDYFEGMRPYLTELAGEPADEEAAAKIADNVQQHIQELSANAALNRTIPFIHNPELKSQFSVYTRNLMPFWFAQEQFVKRWATTFVHSPEAFREAQLTMDGLRHSGVIHKDAYGQDVFTYPGVNLTADALATLMNVTGHKVAMPPPIAFSGAVQFATPGTERLGLPSFGPLVSLPLTALTNMFPELNKTEENILGQRGAGRGYLEQVVPTTITRLAKVFMADPDKDAQLASAQRQAIQIFAAHHQIPDENASPTDRQQFLDKVKGLSRVIAMTRALYGYSVPAAPELQMDPDKLNEDFRNLLGSGLNIHDAVSQFVKNHPGIDVTPYTVFQSKSMTGAPVPSTAATLQQFANNGSYYKDYPLAAAWLLPQNSPDKTFNQTAYRESLAIGLRQMKAPADMLNDIYYAQASQQFFDMLQQKNGLLSDLKGKTGTQATNERALVNQAWSAYEQTYFDTHPVFSDMYQSADGHVKRMEAIDQLHQALADPRAPDATHGPALAQLLATWDELGDAMGQLRTNRTQQGAQMKQRIVQAFSQWAEGYVKANPDLSGVYDRLFRPEVSSV